MSKVINGYIVDTHILLWLIFEPEKIRKGIYKILQDPRCQIYVTSFSFLEISIKFQLGKLELRGMLPDELSGLVEQMAIDVLNVDSTVLESFYQLPKVPDHKDPFDRVIIWQCIQGNYVLLSQDTDFDAYREFGLTLFDS